MLKEEMEKQLGVKVSMAFYVTANGMYVQGPYRNNREFCEMLKHDKLLMASLREAALIRSRVALIRSRIYEVHNAMKVLEGTINFMS